MTASVIHADCLDAMRAMEADSIDAIVTDPPYGLAFMGREWDHGVPGVQFWTEALRIAKPGAHLVAFGGTRTYHRLACAIEDAGWEVRDCLSWLYGSGFPKSLDVSKAIDKAAGAEREILSVWRTGKSGTLGGKSALGGISGEDVRQITAPATDAAREWHGWGTALKPAWEPAIIARKPLAGTVAANVLAHGTGAINVDACRIEGPPSGLRPYVRTTAPPVYGLGMAKPGREVTYTDHSLGRWPANVALDEEAAAMLDEQTGDLAGRGNRGASTATSSGSVAMGRMYERASGAEYNYDGGGGASRFFYTAKASRKERGEGNVHPTVKPLSLMRWLVKLVTPPGGLVLDPFAGSGTTLLAARAEGFRSIGIEREAEYVEIIRRRLSESRDLFSEVP